MTRLIKTGYPAKAVAAFIDGEVVRTPRKENGKDRVTLNGSLLTAEEQRQVARWRNEQEYAELSSVDNMLNRHDMHIWQYENWAVERYGTDTFFDITITNLLESDAQPETAE